MKNFWWYVREVLLVGLTALGTGWLFYQVLTVR